MFPHLSWASKCNGGPVAASSRQDSALEAAGDQSSADMLRAAQSDGLDLHSIMYWTV